MLWDFYLFAFVALSLKNFTFIASHFLFKIGSKYNNEEKIRPQQSYRVEIRVDQLE